MSWSLSREGNVELPTPLMSSIYMLEGVVLPAIGDLQPPLGQPAAAASLAAAAASRAAKAASRAARGSTRAGPEPGGTGGPEDPGAGMRDTRRSAKGDQIYRPYTTINYQARG